ncbi:MAG TPA: VWA domain-containing protein, partial [Pyrinomonadaceae bacterium]|nr:VWA domain-containing protein [Pyrinomonadaceae bacterium]
IRRTYAILVDDLGLSFSSIFWVKDALKKFIKEQMEEGDLVAILRVGTGLGALQSFTSDKRQLLAAVEKIRWNSLANSFSYEPISPALTDEQSLDVSPEQLAQRAAKGEKDEEFNKKVLIDRQSNVATGSLGALNYVIKGMSDLPGRKSVIFFSEGFQIYDRSETSPPIPKPTKVLDALRSVAESATRASVVVYTFDPRGIYAPGADAQDDISGLARNPKGNTQLIRDRETNITDSVDSLRYLAEETGGIANLGNNINKGIEKVFNDQSYYLLGYQPDSETFDPKKDKFNKLEVRLKRPDLKIRYRSGFYGVADDKLKESQTKQTPQQKIYSALSSPFGANEINLSLYSVFYNDFQNRNFIRALVHINAKDLSFTPESDGFYKTSFEIITSIFDSNGISANNGISPVNLRFSKENYAKVLKEGVIYNLETPIIVTGGYQFRVALRDPATNKVGSASQFIEVPDLKKKNLTLSQLIVRNYSINQWNELISGKTVSFDYEKKSILSNTALREFKRGSVISYYYIIYNTKWDTRKSPKLEVQTRLFKDGKLLMGNEPETLNIGNQKDLNRIEASNAVTLGTDLALGDYILQIIVIDKNADRKKQIATQWIDFEIVG